MRSLVACIVAGVLAVTPASATAASYPGERDAMSNPNVRADVTEMSGWLAGHGIHECATQPGGRIMMAPDLENAGGRTMGCDVWVWQTTVAQANSGDLAWMFVLCYTVAHELLHTAGYSHAMMGESPDGKIGPGIEHASRDACDAYVGTQVYRHWKARLRRLRAQHRADARLRTASCDATTARVRRSRCTRDA